MAEKEVKEVIAELILKEIPKSSGFNKKDIEAMIEIPVEQNLGDFAFPCFKLSSVMKKNPIEIAKQLEKEIKVKGDLEKVEAKGGYINFFLNKSTIASDLFKEINEDYGKENIGKNKKVVIDFSSPNVGKPMHIGHIRSTIIGDSLMRIHNFLGYNTVGINYLGDIGLHIGKLIVAWELWLDKKALTKDSIKELLRLYVKFCEKEKSELETGLDEESEDYSNNEWTNKAKEKLKLIELGDEKAHKIWKEIRDSSGKGFDRVYQMLKVNFHETTGQSYFSNAGKEIILNFAKKGTVNVEKETGAMYIEFEDKKGKEILPKKFVLRSNGTASYMTQDIGAAVSRFKNYKFDKMIYVTDYRQSLHFQQLFEILRRFNYDFSAKCSHVGFGTVNFGKEILATRAGNIILLEDVLKKTIEKADEEIKKRKAKGEQFDETKNKIGKNESGCEERAEAIGVGAIKYIILRNEPIKDIEFSWDAALKFEGDTGPYLQYSYARASSILKKAKKNKTKGNKTIDIPKKLEEEETALIKKIQEFPDIVKSSANKLDPSLIAHYSFSLSQIFNDFYHNCQVIDAKEGKEVENFRLKLIEAFRITLKNALYLLGIEVMNEM